MTTLADDRRARPARRHRPIGDAQRGSVMVFVVIATLMLLVIVGLATDTAQIYTAKQSLQQASDSAALAAVRLLNTEHPPHTLSRQQAVTIAALNDAVGAPVQLRPNPVNDPAGDIVIGRWDLIAKTFTPTTWQPNAVRVRARRTAESLGGSVATLFGSMLGRSATEVSTFATATHGSSGGGVPRILVLDPDDPHAFEISGSATLDVSLGTIHVNSNNTCGLYTGGGGTITTMQASVVGSACYGVGDIVGPVVEAADVYPDPLAHLLPTATDWDTYRSGMAAQPGSNGTGQIEASGSYPPGYYAEGIDLMSTDTAFLNPGIYMFGGYGIKVDGQAQLSGAGVSLLIDSGGKMTVAGTSAFGVLSAPSTGDFAGVTIFSHPDNASEGGEESKGKNPHGGEQPWDVFVAGTADMDIDGAIYVPSGHVRLSGTAGQEIGGIICNTFDNDGNIGFAINGDGMGPIDLQPAGYLVE